MRRGQHDPLKGTVRPKIQNEDQSWSRPRRYKHRRSAAKKMFSDVALSRSLSSLTLTSAIVDALREATTSQALAALMNPVTSAMGFRHFALIHNDALRVPRSELVDLRPKERRGGQELVSK